MKVKHSKFRSPVTNARWTRQLFVEEQNKRLQDELSIEPMYSLYYDYTADDGTPLPNFRKEYVRLGDPTGYELSKLYLEDYDHWNLLLQSKWFRDAKESWDIELDAKLKAEGMAAIKLLANGVEGVQPSVQLSAAKFLATGGHREKPKGLSRGRPTKEEISGELKQQAADAKDFADDLKRISLVKK